ncbi:MAG: hypothetical protein ACNFW9_04510 [Candidatus Kerfeldbacteria bacterium]
MENQQTEEQNQQPTPQPKKPKKKFYTRWWFWTTLIIILMLIIGVVWFIERQDENSSNNQADIASWKSFHNDIYNITLKYPDYLFRDTSKELSDGYMLYAVKPCDTDCNAENLDEPVDVYLRVVFIPNNENQTLDELLNQPFYETQKSIEELNMPENILDGLGVPTEPTYKIDEYIKFKIDEYDAIRSGVLYYDEPAEEYKYEHVFITLKNGFIRISEHSLKEIKFSSDFEKIITSVDF